MRVRGGAEPELVHPLWNSFKHAVRDAGLEMAVLKLTVISNFNHGAWSSGDRFQMKSDYFKSFLGKQPPEYFEELSDEISLDRHQPAAESPSVSIVLEAQDLLSSEVMVKRLAFAIWLRLKKEKKKRREEKRREEKRRLRREEREEKKEKKNKESKKISGFVSGV